MDKNITEIDTLTLQQLISEQVKKHPEKTAIKYNGQSITYFDLDASSNQMAAYFIANGIVNNDIIAVVTNRSIELVVCLLGIIKAGAAYLPIDPNLPADRVNFIIDDCSAKILLTTQEYAEVYKATKKIIIDEACIKRHDYPATMPAIAYNSHELAYILYTSGSTGLPKGVAIERRNLLNLLLSIQKMPGICAEDIMLGITTISFDIAELEIFLPLISGAQLLIVDNEVAKDGRALLEIIKAEQISIVQATPFTWQMILQSGWHQALPVKAFCGGEAMSKDLASKLLDRCTAVWNMYGPTETTIYSTIKQVTADDELITIGNPIHNTEVYILNEEHQKVPEGEEGEIYIGGAGVARGYLCRPELNEERFIDDKFTALPGGKIYKTGDWGKILQNGEIQYLGRIDHQVKIRGYRIETEEIEYQLKQLKGIKEALIVPHEDHLAHKQLVAYIVVKKIVTRYQYPEKIVQWKNNLKSILPSYMVPVHFIIIPQVPLMPNGKVDRKMLPPPTPKPLSYKNKRPRNQTEITLTDIIIKNTHFERIGINENFIDLGIDSLRALMIIVDIEAQFDKRLPLTVLVHHPSIKLLASFIDSLASSPYNSLINMKKGGLKVPLYLVHGIDLNIFNFTGMVKHLDEGQPVYGLRAAGLDGNHDPLVSIEEIAAYYNQELLNHDPIGPYAIAGYSLGGIVAYEMTRQLKQAGKRVEMLAMFDTNAPEPVQPSLLGKVIRKISRQFYKLAFRAHSFFGNPVSNFTYIKQLYKNKAKDSLIRMGILDKYKTSGLPEYMQKVVDKLEIAWNNYAIEPSEIKVDLFKAKKRIYFIDEPEYLGWTNYALDGVNIYDVPGDHENMFKAPNDHILAALLQKRLNEIPDNSPGLVAESA